MGWRPWEVRACGLGEFEAALNGWLKSQGVDPDVKAFGPDDLRALKERYPDDRGSRRSSGPA